MERQYTRIDYVREILDRDLKAIPDEEIKRCAYVHLYGVGQAAALIAMKRGYGRKNAELAETAGMLHDYVKYIYNEEENHAEKSAICAREILEKIPEYTEEDITCVCEAIHNHSKKREKGNPFDEILKDADEMQHYFRNPVEEYFFQKERVQRLLAEFGIADND
ncbi:MAG: HD domain-containing protein [Acetatifactor sp.]